MDQTKVDKFAKYGRSLHHMLNYITKKEKCHMYTDCDSSDS